MIFILMGDIQTGKTRWLQRLVEDLQGRGVPCYGILSPGVWRLHEETGGIKEYEKLGIETVFLPSMRRALFAIRRDIAEKGSRVNDAWQSAKAGLGWIIPDATIAVINKHFDSIMALCDKETVLSQGDEKTDTPDPSPWQCKGLLIVDELGQLELIKGGGFTSAMRLLEKGSTPLYNHAIVVARSGLANLAQEYLSKSWGEVSRISHRDQAKELLVSLFSPDFLKI